MPQPPQPPQPQGSDSKTPGPRRALGPVLMVASMLLLLLILYGSGTPAKQISEDAFWYQLYTGQIENPVIDGPHTIVAYRRESANSETTTRITVSVTDTADIKDRIREINARQRGDSLPINNFVKEVEAGNLQPLKGYPIRLRELQSPEDPTSGDVIRHRFFVDYADLNGMHYAEVIGANRDRIDILTLTRLLQDHGAEIEAGLNFDTISSLRTEEQNSMMLFFFSTFGPILLLVLLFWFLFMRQMRGQGGMGGMMNFSRSTAKLYDKDTKSEVTFKDVAGIDEAKEEVGEIIEFLKYPEKFKKLGGRIPRGVLLVGAPGTGKTLMAKAIAGEADVPFLSISGSDFVEMFVGVGASRVRDLFKTARESAPCIVFLDEIDAVGRKRGSGMGGGHDEREQTLNAILVEMDGFGTDGGVILIAATNRPDVLDPALLRPGRFDREIVIDLPDVNGRTAILAVHAANIIINPAVDLNLVARGTPGFSGAELAALVNEAAIAAAMADRDSVTQPDFEEARDKVRFGREKKSRVMEPEDKRITAYHEAGHAVVNTVLEGTEPVHKVTIIPRGMALGATMMLPEKDRMHLTRNQMLAELAVLYGGRAAEEIFCDDITAGAANDIQRATQLAKMMVTEWGMSESIGPVNLADRMGSEFLGTEFTVGKDHSEDTVSEIDQEVRRLAVQAHARATEVIKANRDEVTKVADALLLYETISGGEVCKLIYDGVAVTDLREQPLPPPLPEITQPQPSPVEESDPHEDGTPA